jgi:hypothetical protein
MYSVGNVALSVYNFKDLKIVRTVAKATVKETIAHKKEQKEPKQSDTNQPINEKK